MDETRATQAMTADSGAHLSRSERRRVNRQMHTTGGGSNRMFRRVAVWGGALLALFLIGWGMVALSSRVTVPPADGTLAVPVTGSDHTMGPADAPVTLVEYSDFQCPACAAFAPVVKQALAEPQLKDKVRFIYRSFPLSQIHPNAERAARAGEAAAQQNKFWEMHDALFEFQAEWSKLSGSAAETAFSGYAKDIGMDVEAFTAAMGSSEVKKLVKDQSDGAIRSGVNSTPTFFINGKQMPQPSSYDAFRQYLINALNANP